MAISSYSSDPCFSHCSTATPRDKEGTNSSAPQKNRKRRRAKSHQHHKNEVDRGRGSSPSSLRRVWRKACSFGEYPLARGTRQKGAPHYHAPTSLTNKLNTQQINVLQALHIYTCVEVSASYAQTLTSILISAPKNSVSSPTPFKINGQRAAHGAKKLNTRNINRVPDGQSKAKGAFR